jgi:hypothetical protein
MARSDKNSLLDSDDGNGIRHSAEGFEAPETPIKLSELPIGARLLVRSRTDWRTAAIARFVEETKMVVLTARSPSGHSYRLRRDCETEVMFEGGFAILPADAEDTWRENFSPYDSRW